MKQIILALALTIFSYQYAKAVKLGGVNGYAYNVNGLANLGGPDHADSGLFCAWYKTGLDSGTILQSVKYVGGTPYEMFSVKLKRGYAAIYMADETGNTLEIETAIKVPYNSTWQQIAILFFPAAGSARIAVNGVIKQTIINEQHGSSFFLPVANQIWTVGASGATTGPYDFYHGNLDQVYFYAFNDTYLQMTSVFEEACGVNIGKIYAPIRPGPFGAYMVQQPGVGNPLPQIMLQGKTREEFLYNQGGATSFFGGQGMTTSPNDPFVLVPNLYQ